MSNPLWSPILRGALLLCLCGHREHGLQTKG
jgi:hypothetical protein